MSENASDRARSRRVPSILIGILAGVFIAFIIFLFIDLRSTSITTIRTSSTPITSVEVNTRVDELEKDLNTLTATISVLGIAATILLGAAEFRTILSGRNEQNVLDEVAQVLALDADFAKRQLQREDALKEREKTVVQDEGKLQEERDAVKERVEALIGEIQELRKNSPEERAEAILEDIIVMRQDKDKSITRYNLSKKKDEIAVVVRQMTALEDIFGVTRFQNDPGCHYVRGIHALIGGRYRIALDHFKKALDLIDDRDTRWNDPYTKPMCLYFQGIIRKNENGFGDADDSLNKALTAFKEISQAKPEERTLLELAEVAVQFRSPGALNDITEARTALAKIEAGGFEMNDDQKANFVAQQDRLANIAGNCHFMQGKALETVEGLSDAVKAHYAQAIEQYENLNSDQFSPYVQLSVVIAMMRRDGHKHAQTDDEKSNLKAIYDYWMQDARYLSHFEHRGRILRLGSLIITARLHGNLHDNIQALETRLDDEIISLRSVNNGAASSICIFSALSKEQVPLITYRDMIRCLEEHGVDAEDRCDDPV